MKRTLLTSLLISFGILLNAVEVDTVYIKELKKQAFQHLTKTHNYDSVIHVCKEGTGLCQAEEFQNYQGKFLSYHALALKKQNKYEEAIEVFNKAIQVNLRSGSLNEAAICYNNLGTTYMYSNDYENAKLALKQSIEIAKNIKNDKRIISSYNVMGLVAKREQNYKEAIEYYLKSLKLAEQQERLENCADALGNIGSCYNKIENYELSKTYFIKALEVENEIGNDYRKISKLINVGLGYNKVGQPDSALYFYNKGIDLAKKYKNKRILTTAYSNIATIYSSKRQYNKALGYSQKAVEISREIKHYSGLIASLINTGENYINLNRLNKAEALFNEAFNIAKDKDVRKWDADIFDSFSKLYIKKRDFQKALDYKIQSYELNDSILSNKLKVELEELNIAYETEKKEEAIRIKDLTIANQQKDIQNKKERLTLYAIGIVLLILFSGIVFTMFMQKQKAYKLLVKKNVEQANSEIELNITQQTEDSKVDDAQKYSNSYLTDKQKSELLDALSRLIKEEEIYCNVKLTIDEVAKALDTNRRYLSQIINEHYGLNFSNFINEYRIHKAKQLLINPEFDNYTIEGIATESGFHSRVAFNNAFKKNTGVTPSFFKKNRSA